MPVSFNNVSGIKLDHTVEKHIFDVIILMMVHDGFHDFYNDKSKGAFLDLFEKLDLPKAAQTTASKSGGALVGQPRKRSSDESQNPSKLQREDKKRDRSSNEPPNARARKLLKGSASDSELLKGSASDSELLDDINNLLFNLTIIETDIELKHNKEEDPSILVFLSDEDIKNYIGVFTELKNEYIDESFFRPKSKDEQFALNSFEENTLKSGSDILTVLEGLENLLYFFESKKIELSQKILKQNPSEGDQNTRPGESIETVNKSLIISDELRNQSIKLLTKGQLVLHSTLRDIYDELSITLKNDNYSYGMELSVLEKELLNEITSKTFDVLEKYGEKRENNLDEVVNIGKSFILFEFYKLRSYQDTNRHSLLSYLIEIFKSIDVNNDGRLTQAEFIKYLRKEGGEDLFGIRAPTHSREPEEGIKDFQSLFQKMDLDGDKVISLDEFKDSFFKDISSVKEDELLTGDLKILEDYINDKHYTGLDFEDYYYDNLYANLKQELEEAELLGRLEAGDLNPEEEAKIRARLTVGVGTSSGTTGDYDPSPTQDMSDPEGTAGDDRRQEPQSNLALSVGTSSGTTGDYNPSPTQDMSGSEGTAGDDLQEEPQTNLALSVGPPLGTTGGVYSPAAVRRYEGKAPGSPATEAPDSPQKVGGAASSGALVPGTSDTPLRPTLKLRPTLTLRDSTDFLKQLYNVLDISLGKTKEDNEVKLDFVTSKEDHWWTDGDNSTVSSFNPDEWDKQDKERIKIFLESFGNIVSNEPTSDYIKQIEYIKSIIFKYENLKKLFSNKLFHQVKTKSANISIPNIQLMGRSKDLFDELSIFYEYRGTEKKIYISIVEFIYIIYLHYGEKDIQEDRGDSDIANLKSSIIINSYKFGRSINAEGSEPQGRQVSKEYYKIYKALEEKLDKFCKPTPTLDSLETTKSRQLLDIFSNDKIADHIDNINNLLCLLKKLKKYIERYIPSISDDKKKLMTGQQKIDWAKIFQSFANDYVKIVKFNEPSKYGNTLFGEIINYAGDASLPMKKGDSLDREIWNKLGSNQKNFTVSDKSDKRIINNAMPPQMKKLFPKLKYLCNTSILDPMGSFGSCSGVNLNTFPKKGEYVLDYEIRFDDLNYIKINLPVKAINDVSIVGGEVNVVVEGTPMVKDKFTLTHFNSEEPFSISNTVNKLRPITDDMTDVDKKDALQNNRNILFRKFLGDFLQALQVFTNIKTSLDNTSSPTDVYYTSNDKPASIMLQILLYSYNPDQYVQAPPQDYGGHVEKDKSRANDVSEYKWKVHYYHPKLDKNIKLYMDTLILSPPTSPVVRPSGTTGGGGKIKKNTRRKSRKNTRRKSRKNTRIKSRKNTRRKNTRRKNTRRKNTRRKNTRRKNTRRKNTRRKNTKRRSKRSRRK